MGDLIWFHYKEIEISIKNMAEEYPEGRNVLIRCLANKTHHFQFDIIQFLKEKNIKIYDINGFKITDGSDRIK